MGGLSEALIRAGNPIMQRKHMLVHTRRPCQSSNNDAPWTLNVTVTGTSPLPSVMMAVTVSLPTKLAAGVYVNWLPSVEGATVPPCLVPVGIVLTLSTSPTSASVTEASTWSAVKTKGAPFLLAKLGEKTKSGSWLMLTAGVER